MHTSYRRAWRLVPVLMLFVLVAVQFVPSQTAQAADSYCVAGNFNDQAFGVDNAMYDDGSNGDDTPNDGIYSAALTITSAGTYDFKVKKDCDWNESYPGQDSWFVTDTAEQQVTITFDTNSYADGYVPSTNIVHVEGDAMPISFNAVGGWQDPVWTNDDLNTAMVDQGGGIHKLDSYTVATPNTYEAKVTVTADWDKQYGGDGRSKNSSVTYVTTTAPNETITVYLDTNTSRIKYVANGDGEGGADKDGNIWWADLGHDSRDSLYRTPSMAVPVGQDVTLRFRAAKNDLTGAMIRLWNDRDDVQTMIPMSIAASDDDYDYWESLIETGAKVNVFYYRFIAYDGAAVAYYEDTGADGGWGETIGESEDKSWQLTVYDPAFSTPDWVKNAIVYQIFADRFHDGDSSNNPTAGQFFYNEDFGTVVRSGSTQWNTPICDPRQDTNDACEGSYSRNFYGGDLQGIIDKLDYLKNDLGVNTLYLNPIFESPSNHKYDTKDFSIIDDNFGTLATFQSLITALDNHSMYLILDGVFNHTSSDSLYFDRYGRWDADGELTALGTDDGSGACESLSSPYTSWYTFFDYEGAGDAPCSDNRDYPKWFGIFDSLPVLRTAEKSAQDLVWGDGYAHPSGVSAPIAAYWISLGADGWRLDVAPEVDHGIQAEKTDPRELGANDYWENFRATVHTANPNAYITGEEWGLATSWTSGGVTGGVTFPDGNPGEWDATMNYQQSSAILSFWRDTSYTDNDFNTGSSAGPLNPLKPSEVNARLLSLKERYAPEAFYAMMNLFGSHDTNRALFMLDHGHPAAPADGTRYPTAASHDFSDAIQRLKGAALMQMTLPGTPTIYYGDEIGSVGQSTYSGGKWEDDPYNRVPFPWLDETGTPYFDHLKTDTAGSTRAELLAYYNTLTTTRMAHESLRTGSFEPVLVDDINMLYAYVRRTANGSDSALVIVNRGGSPADVTVNVAGILPNGATYDDALTVAVEALAVAGDEIAVTGVPANGGALLVLASGGASAPDASTNLDAEVSSPTQVDLTWDVVTDADSYIVYRSLVSGGGYEAIGMSTTNSFYDDTVVTGTQYYYVVAAKDDTTGLVSGYSNESDAFPQWDLVNGNVWYKLDTETITHTISVFEPTGPIQGQLFIDGGTAGLGEVSGIVEQVGWGASTDPTDGTWKWEPMAYTGENGNNDLYQGTLLPDQVGTFNMLVRFSADGGTTWVYADTNGRPSSDAFGTLTVEASDDTTDPSAPQNLTVVGTTSSSVSLEWAPSVDTLMKRGPGVAFYRVYRKLNGSADAAEVVGKTADGTTLAYTDLSVIADETYDYYVTAVDNSFNESAASNTVTAKAEDVLVDVTFRATVPTWTPGTVYIVGDQQEWGPWDPGKAAMTQVDDSNVWEYTTQFLTGTEVTYKFARGSWDRVEKQLDGFAEVADRKASVTDEGSRKMLIEVDVVNWRDLIVTETIPVNGESGVDEETTISVTWNKDLGAASEFSVTDADSTPVAGTYSYDAGTKVETFTPDAALLPGTYTVTASGAEVGGDKQFVDKTFTFTVDEPVAAGAFNLLSPADEAYIRQTADLNAMSWESATDATSYTLTALHISGNVRLGMVLNKTLGADVCSEETKVCTYTLESAERDALEDGLYTWTVVANGVTEAQNGPFSFVLDTADFVYIVNGGFEADVDGDKLPDGWNAKGMSKDKLKCNKDKTDDGDFDDEEDKLFTSYGACAFMFRGVAGENSRLIQNFDGTTLMDGDTLVFEAMVDPRNAPADVTIGKVIVRFDDSSKEKLALKMPVAAEEGGYVKAEISSTAPLALTGKTVTKFKAQVGWRQTSKRFFIDEVKLYATQQAPGGSLVPLPDLPGEGGFRR